LGALGVLVIMSANANPPSSVDVQIRGWVNELQQDRLTAARHNAQRELENSGDAAVPALLDALRAGNVIWRRNAAEMLGFIASPGSVNGLKEALANDAAPVVRRNAAWALGEVNSFAAVNDLQRAAVMDSNALVRQTAQDSLARIRTRLALTLGVGEQELNAFAVAPDSPQVVYVATNRDLQVTRDGGKTWTTLNKVLPSLVNVLAVSPASALTLYAGVDGLGMYKSVDGGHEWTAINNGLPVAPGALVRINAITIDLADAQNIVISSGVLVGTQTVEFIPLGIQRSNDGGETWTNVQDNHSPLVQSRLALTKLALEGNVLYALAGNQVLVYRLN
jgi:hypothetical protein